jgi:hypothetical protein
MVILLEAYERLLNHRFGSAWARSWFRFTSMLSAGLQAHKRDSGVLTNLFTFHANEMLLPSEFFVTRCFKSILYSVEL